MLNQIDSEKNKFVCFVTLWRNIYFKLITFNDLISDDKKSLKKKIIQAKSANIGPFASYFVNTYSF